MLRISLFAACGIEASTSIRRQAAMWRRRRERASLKLRPRRKAAAAPAGFDVDVYGIAPANRMTLPGTDPAYALGYTELEKIADGVSHRVDNGCAVEVITFPSTVVLDTRFEERAEGMIRVRIYHHRGLDQPFGPAEERALDEFEDPLRNQGLARR